MAWMRQNYFSQKELDGFKRDGFIVVRQMYSRDEIRQLSNWIDEIAQRPPKSGKEMVYYEDSWLEKGRKVLSRIEKFVEGHEKISEFVHAEKMTARAAELLGEPATLFKEKINFKMPGGGGFKPHQDIQPGWDDYARYYISVLITVDESTVENGCLELASGHQKRGRIGRKWEPLEGRELEGVEFKKYPMAPGDVVYFDCFVPHQSQENLTDKPRRNLYLTFNASSEGDHREKYFADKRKNYPPDHEREKGKEYIFRV